MHDAGGACAGGRSRICVDGTGLRRQAGRGRPASTPGSHVHLYFYTFAHRPARADAAMRAHRPATALRHGPPAFTPRPVLPRPATAPTQPHTAAPPARLHLSLTTVWTCRLAASRPAARLNRHKHNTAQSVPARGSGYLTTAGGLAKNVSVKPFAVPGGTGPSVTPPYRLAHCVYVGSRHLG